MITSLVTSNFTLLRVHENMGRHSTGKVSSRSHSEVFLVTSHCTLKPLVVSGLTCIHLSDVILYPCLALGRPAGHILAEQPDPIILAEKFLLGAAFPNYSILISARLFHRLCSVPRADMNVLGSFPSMFALLLPQKRWPLTRPPLTFSFRFFFPPPQGDIIELQRSPSLLSLSALPPSRLSHSLMLASSFPFSPSSLPPHIQYSQEILFISLLEGIHVCLSQGSPRNLAPGKLLEFHKDDPS